MKRSILLLLLATSCATASAQQPVAPTDQSTPTETKPYLSTEQIQAALDRANGKPHNAGILIADRESAIQAGMSCEKCGGAMYTVRAYTPSQWIESGAILAKKHNETLTVATVSPRMRSPAFRVYVYQVRRAVGKMELPDPIQDVQIADAKQKEILKPLKENEKDAKGMHADSTTSTTGSSEATVFDMKEVDRISNNGASDIFIVVTTHSGHSDYIKIKAQELKE